MTDIGRVSLRRGTPLVAAAVTFAIAGCGSGGAKVGDCVGANNGTGGSGSSSEPKASVVDCKSPQAKAKLVSKRGNIACVNIQAGGTLNNDYAVSVGGEVFCARPK
jgi:phage tail tape-measure protein